MLCPYQGKNDENKKNRKKLYLCINAPFPTQMNKKTYLLLFFIALKFILQYLAIDSGYELHRDEYLHLDLGKHLAWGYQSVPPVTGWISYLILILGNSVFWVKFFPALFGALTILVVWKIIEELKGSWFALILGAVGVTFSALLRINTLYQPNSLEFLLWTVLFYTAIKYINSENFKWIWMAALTFAIGFLNKYNISFLLAGLLPTIILSEHRKLFLNKHFYFAIIATLVIISPNLYWQYSNGFPVVHHLETLANNQLVNVNRYDFLKEQLLFFTGALFVIIAGLISFFRHTSFKKYRLFFWSYIFTIALYFYLKAKAYYAIGLYPMLLAFGAVYLEQLLRKGWWRNLRPVLIAIPILLMIPMHRILVPVLSPEQIIEKADIFNEFGLLRWEDGKNHDLPQDYADMRGWKELAALVDSAFDSIDEKEQVLIHCDNYGQAGAINFYGKQQYTQAVSLNADYMNWYELDAIEYKHIILVQHYTDTDKDREREKPWFESISLVGEIKDPYAREKGSRVYLLKDAKISINDYFKKEIQSRKNGEQY